MNTLPTNVLYDIYCPKSDGSVIREAQKRGGGENSPISPPLDPRLGWEELGAELVTKAVTHKAQLSKQTANMATKAVLHLR